MKQRASARRAAAVALALLCGACVERQGSPLADARVSTAESTGAGARADSVRDAVATALREVARASVENDRARYLGEARALARQYALEWRDSTLLRRVDRFAAAPPRARRDMAAADSLWRSGREAFGREGVPAAMRLWRASLRHARAARDTALHATVLNAIGAGFYSAGALDSAASYLDASYRLATVARDYRTMGNALGNLASVSKDRGDLAAAAEQYERASVIRARSGDSRGLAADQNNLGLIAWQLGDLAQARAAFTRALELNRSEGRDRIAAVNLTNLGDLASQASDYAVAETSYRRALALNAAAGDSAEMAFVLGDLGRLWARRGDYARAIGALRQALALHDRSGAAAEAVSVRADFAAVQVAVGELQQAITTLRSAEAAAIVNEVGPEVHGGLALAHADVALQLGRFGDAEARYARAEQLYEQADAAAGITEARLGQAALRVLRNDHAGALELLSGVARRQSTSGDRRAGALTQLLVGDVQRQLGDTASARRTLSAALDTLTDIGDVAGEALALRGLGELSAQHGRALAAESLYRRALERIGTRRIPHITWRVQASLAEALLQRGALDAAAEQLQAAIATVEQVAARLHVEDRQAAFLDDKWNVYARLAEVEHMRGRDGAAFHVGERLRARRMLDALTRGRVATRTPESAREQDLRRRIAELSNAVEADATQAELRRDPAFGATELAPRLEALQRAQREYGELLMELREADARHAVRINARPASWEAVARRLPPRTALLEYLVGDSSVMAFVVTRDTVAAIELDISARELGHLTDFGRMTMQRPDSGGASLWRAPLRRLHQHLVQPIVNRGFLHDVRKLIIVPHAELHFLPFSALLEPGPKGSFLVERFDISYAPSATAWLRLSERKPPTGNRKVLALAPNPDRLPGSADEVAAIREVFGRRTTVLTGAAATERALREAAPDYRIIHLATFGVLNRHNPLFSHIELAREPRDGGRFEVHEVYGLELNGQLVVLSACQTALASGAVADVPIGDDWIGLVQAFLEAGASDVLAAQWPVEDRATARLMHHFYRALAQGLPESAALAAAQRAMLRNAAGAHPFYWAGFVLNGASR